MELRYRHVEAAVAAVLEIRPEKMGALRGRVRHLRNLGVPELPSPGSGQAIAYTRQQALELLLALELEKTGQAPKWVALTAQSIVRQSPYEPTRNSKWYVIVSEKKDAYTVAASPQVLLQAMKKAPDVVIVINVGALVRKLDQALNGAMKSA